jgi:hypothetical protein
MISNRFAGGGVIIGTQEQIERQFKRRLPQMNRGGGPVASENEYLPRTGGLYEKVYLTGRDLAEFQAEDTTGFRAMKDYFLRNFQAISPQNLSTPHIESGKSYRTDEPMERFTCRDIFD